jgi:predicted enzyme related to lactoylglutathione lyase
MSTDVRSAVGTFVWHEHVSSDPERAQHFYRELFGWEIEVFKPGEMDYGMIMSGGTTHGGFGKSQGAAPSHWMGHVLVEDVDATAGKVKAAGGKLLFGPEDIPEVGRFVVFADPEGAVVSGFQPEGGGGGQQAAGVFAWDELMAKDVEAEKRFYGEVFGWTPSDMDMGGGFTYTMFKVGDRDAAGGMPLGDIPAPPNWCTYITPDDVDETVARARKLGASVMREPWDIAGVGRIAILEDPLGAVFGLYKPES